MLMSVRTKIYVLTFVSTLVVRMSVSVRLATESMALSVMVIINLFLRYHYLVYSFACHFLPSLFSRFMLH